MLAHLPSICSGSKTPQFPTQATTSPLPHPLQPDTTERISLALRLVKEGRSEDVAFRATDVDGAAMSARRWLSLAVPGGDDDMFSSSLTDAQLQQIYGPLQGLPALVLLSGAEEYLPPGLDYQRVGRRLAQVCLQAGRAASAGWHDDDARLLLLRCDLAHPARHTTAAAAALQAMGPTARLEVVEGALHALNGKEEEGAAAIAAFVASL